MSLFGWLGGSVWAQRRLLKRSDVRFCAALELVGFEAYHAIEGKAFHLIVPAHEHQPIAARAARLYFEDAASITVAGESGPVPRDVPVLVVRAEPLLKGRFRVVVAREQDTA